MEIHPQPLPLSVRLKISLGHLKIRTKPMDKTIPRVLITIALFFSLLLSAVGQCSASTSAEFTYGYDAEEFTLAYLNVTYVDPSTGQSRSTKEEAGKFSVGRVEPVSGLMVRVSSANHSRHDACLALDPDTIPPQGEPWIALIEYGNCGENTKLRNAASSNASAAIVYSDKHGPKLIKMHHRVFQIVSVFITKEKGEELISLMENGTRVLLHVTVGSHNAMRYANINRTSVLFVSISFIILMVISLAWLVFYYVQRFRYIHAKDLLARRLCSAAKKALDKIPVKSIRSGDREAEGDFECCAVCIEPFKVSEVVRTLPCKHTFHKCCVDPWLLEQRSCPMCKMDILKYYGLVFSGSQESVLNIDDHDLQHHHGNQHYQRQHGQAEVEILHVHHHLHPIPLSSSGSDVTPTHHYHRNTVALASSEGCGIDYSSCSSSNEDGGVPGVVGGPIRLPHLAPPCRSPRPPRIGVGVTSASVGVAVIEGNLVSPLRPEDESPPLLWNPPVAPPTESLVALPSFRRCDTPPEHFQHM